MSQKIVDVSGIGRVVLAKRRGTHNLRLTIRPDGVVRVGMPFWAPYAAGIDFAISRRQWINRHTTDNRPSTLLDGHRIGKSFRLRFDTSPSHKQTRSRLTSNTILISSPLSYSENHAQVIARRACEKALKREGHDILVPRLTQLAEKHGFSFSEVRIKRLTSKWGSCSEQNHIVLNYFLVQLPWPLIDYVLIHELVHTKYLNHSPEFWRAMEKVIPAAKELRNDIKKYRPLLLPG